MDSSDLEPDWQLHQKSISDRCGYLLKSEQWSDCCFIVGTEPNQKRYNAHKIILAMASPVFQAMFFGGMAEHEHIPILDVQPDAFKALLDYIYTDQINIATFDQACEVCYAAKKYMLPHLVEQCTRRIFEDLYASNACKAYEFAKLFEEPILMQRSLEIICNETEGVLADPSFEDVELSTLLLIFDSPKLNISSERDLFNALMRWAGKECCRKGLSEDINNLRAVIGPALQKIHFLTLTPLQFAEGPADAPLLTKDESLSILVNISNPRTPSVKFPMPEGFSRVVEPRMRYRLLPHRDQSAPQKQNYHKEVKLLCPRPISSSAVHLSNGHTDCTTSFSADRNICIQGIEILSQSVGTTATYTELLYAHLLDYEGSRLTYTHYSCRAEFNKKLEILFNRPVYIQKNKVYRVAVVLNSPGWYEIPVNDERSSVTTNVMGTSFTFYYDADGDKGVVRSIIFAHSVEPSYSGCVVDKSVNPRFYQSGKFI